MKYIINLNRFFMDFDKLESNIKDCAFGLRTIFFDKKNNRFFLETDSIDEGKLRKMAEISEVLPVFIGYKRFSSFSDFNLDILSCFKGVLSKPKTFKVKVKFMSKIPISSISVIKRINTLLKKEGLLFNEENPDIYIYVEFDKDNKGKKYLISMYNKENTQKQEYSSDRAIILCNPGSIIEISDFLRLSYVFKIPLIIISENTPKFKFSLNKAKKITKGIAYDGFPLKIMVGLPQGYIFVGFSKLATENEQDLIPVLTKKAKLAFVFGDEKFGLSDKLRNKMDYMVKLTTEQRKPLRASHALSYVLGLEKALELKK